MLRSAAAARHHEQPPLTCSMSTFVHDGETFWYDATGHGVPVIALHGGLGLDHTYLRPALDALGPGIEVCYLDLRANGRSTGDGTGMTLAQLADDVDAFRAHLGLDRVAVLGHSYGGFVALEHALAYPDRLSHLLLCDTSTRAPVEQSMVAELDRLGVDPGVLAAFAEPVEDVAGLLDVFDVVEVAYFPHGPVGVARRGLADTIYRPGGAQGGDAALAGWDVTARLAEITVPTLVISGADDFLFPSDGARALADALPVGQLVVLERAGHLPFVDQPERFREAVRAFVLPPEVTAQGPA